MVSQIILKQRDESIGRHRGVHCYLIREVCVLNLNALEFFRLFNCQIFCQI